jgi:riboflavin kinase/FMN adenylyltransferase
MLEQTALDILFIQTFDKGFSKITPEDFIEKILVNELKINCLVVGEDFRFGNNRSGTTKLINELAAKHGFEFKSISLLKFAQEIFSSSKIRELLSYGAIDEANNILGYKYFIKNTIIKGKQNGRKIGFPTANLSLENLYKPKRGVYTAIVEIEGRKEKYKSIANLGTRPTIDEQELLEVHIFDFNEEIYGKKLKVYLNKYIRPQIKFKNLEELKTQIRIDVQKAKSLLAK